MQQLKEHITCKNTAIATFSLLNGALYYFVTCAGIDNVKDLFHLDSSVALKVLGIGASITYAMFTYKLLENLTLKPKSPPSIILIILSPFAASSFFTSATQGADWLGIPFLVSVSIGLAMFLFRTLAIIDSSVKFPDKFNELVAAWREAVAHKDYAETTRFTIAALISLGVSLCITDAIYASVTTMGTFLSISHESLLLSIFSYVAAGLGAVATIPISYYWTLRGIRQLTFGGKPNEHGVTSDPTDKHTIVAAIVALPVILGALGTTTSATGMVFGQLGMLSIIVRVVTSVIYALSGSTPGLSTLSRGLGSSMHGLFFSTCRDKPSNELHPDFIVIHKP